MNEIGLIIRLLNETLIQTAILSLPFLIISLLVGLIISIFQATTSIQEQTLTFVPKFIAIGLLILLIGPILIRVFTDFTIRLFDLMATGIRGL
ncbi:MAG: flagellar biosynthetic protein FliQ [Spirochaetia bacterium]|nr:flagellar biosynthetic protein FliQ [Spirochaetota bacterium]MCX8096893.1 flagellar biosynthetic protein FliQ [Spirochaetota bacterium]MDW8112466.1 flagellar biosynthetic protein FliQ [Spirochaetia bacterium]